MLGLALGASARDNDQGRHRGRQRAEHAATARAVTPHRGQHLRRSASIRRTQQHAISRQGLSRAVVRRNNQRASRLQVAHQRNTHRARVTARSEVTANGQGTATLRRGRVSREQRALARNGRRLNRARNVTVVNHWRSERFRGANYAAFHNYRREWHDRGWWRNHYDRIIFVGPGWGWWAWGGGYWYPAWGYEAGFNYPYYGPIYSYGDLTPNQIVANVQLQLQRDGYDPGPADGVLGPMTRRALADFQVDHGLVITSTIDRPTLATLGLV